MLTVTLAHAAVSASSDISHDTHIAARYGRAPCMQSAELDTGWLTKGYPSTADPTIRRGGRPCVPKASTQQCPGSFHNTGQNQMCSTKEESDVCRDDQDSNTQKAEAVGAGVRSASEHHPQQSLESG